MFVSLALPRLRGDCVVPPPAIHIPFGEKLFDEFCRLVIHDIHFRLVSFCFQRFEYLRVCLINDMAVNIGYGVGWSGIGQIDIGIYVKLMV